MAQQLLAKGENVRNLYLLNSIQTPSRLADMRAQLPHSLERLMNDLSDEVTSYVKQLSPKEQAHWVACANTDEYLLTSYQAKKIRIPVIFLKAQQDYPEDKTNSWDHVADHFISISINTDHAGMMKHPTLEKIAHIVNHYLTNDAWHRV